MVAHLASILTMLLTSGLLYYACRAFHIYEQQCRVARSQYVATLFVEWSKLLGSTDENRDICMEFIRIACYDIMHTSDDVLSDLMATILSPSFNNFYNKNYSEFNSSGSQAYAEVIEYFKVLKNIEFNYGSWAEMKKTFNIIVKDSTVEQKKRASKKH